VRQPNHPPLPRGVTTEPVAIVEKQAGNCTRKATSRIPTHATCMFIIIALMSIWVIRVIQGRQGSAAEFWRQPTVNNFVTVGDRFGWLIGFIFGIRFSGFPARRVRFANVKSPQRL